jgi:hypothetical protein
MSAARVMSEGSRDRDCAGDEVRPAARPYAGGKRSHTKLDRYAPFDLGRAHHLSAPARWMLVTLCLVADFRGAAVRATYKELSEYTGASRDTIPNTLAELVRADLVAIPLPFGQNRAGEVEVLVWDQMVVETPREREARLRVLGSNRGRIADESRTNRGPNADNSANDQGIQPFHRGGVGVGGGRDSWTGDSASEHYGQGEGLSGESYAPFADSSFWATESVRVAPGRRCPDCGGWLGSAPPGEDFCSCRF